MSRRNNPGHGSREAPDFVRRSDSGKPTAVGWSRPANAPKPEKYHYSYSDRRRPGYIVYIFTLVVSIFLCAWLRPVLGPLIEAIGC